MMETRIFSFSCILLFLFFVHSLGSEFFVLLMFTDIFYLQRRVKSNRLSIINLLFIKMILFRVDRELSQHCLHRTSSKVWSIFTSQSHHLICENFQVKKWEREMMKKLRASTSRRAEKTFITWNFSFLDTFFILLLPGQSSKRW